MAESLEIPAAPLGTQDRFDPVRFDSRSVFRRKRKETKAACHTHARAAHKASINKKKEKKSSTSLPLHTHHEAALCEYINFVHT